MNISGLDYNTQRERLIMPEYGRAVQSMVDHAVTITDRATRQACAENIVSTMERMFPQIKDSADYKKKLWDHIAVMSNFKLDIDYPCDVSDALKISSRPEPLPYPTQQIAVRHYGRLVLDTLEKLKAMPAGTERDALTRLAANRMKRSLQQWSHGSDDDAKVAADIARLTDGKIQIDLKTFKFDRIVDRELKETKETNVKKKKKR